MTFLGVTDARKLGCRCSEEPADVHDALASAHEYMDEIDSDLAADDEEYNSLYIVYWEENTDKEEVRKHIHISAPQPLFAVRSELFSVAFMDTCYFKTCTQSAPSRPGHLAAEGGPVAFLGDMSESWARSSG